MTPPSIRGAASGSHVPQGKPIAAYLYLPRPTGTKAVRTIETRRNLLIDYSAEGNPIGIELTAPAHVDLTSVNEVLRKIGAGMVSSDDLAPLRAA